MTAFFVAIGIGLTLGLILTEVDSYWLRRHTPPDSAPRSPSGSSREELATEVLANQPLPTKPAPSPPANPLVPMAEPTATAFEMPLPESLELVIPPELRKLGDHLEALYHRKRFHVVRR